MSLAKFSVKNSVLINLMSVFIVLIGAVSMFNMRREAFPQVNYDIVTVSTVWPGAPTEDIEKFITIPIEKELKAVSGIDELTSKSDEGLSEIGITIDPGVTDKKKVVDDIERAVDRANDLPVEAEDPFVFELASREFPIIEISVGGDISEKLRRQYAEDLEDLLLDIDGVAQIRKYGWRDPEFWVEVDPKKLDEYYVSMQEVMDALRTRNITIPGGQLKTDVDEFNVRTTGEFHTEEEIGNVIIRANDSGNWLRIKDVATVVETFEDETRIAKVNAKRATAMVVVKSEHADAINVVKQIKEVTRNFEKTLPDGMEILLTNDFSYYIERRLGVLKNNGIIGFILVLVILFLFLDPVPAIMTAMGIPIALCMTFFAMSSFGLTINLVSMLGILLVLGMLVDDGIIVAENVYRYIEEGMDVKKATILGTNEVIMPVTITILTTTAAFAPMMFMPDIIGKFIREIPIVVMITLFASLFEAFIILPSHLADFIQYFKTKRVHKEKKWYVKLKAHYIRVLNECIQTRYYLLIFLLLLLVFTVGLVVPYPVKKGIYLFGIAIIGLMWAFIILKRQKDIVIYIVLACFTFSFLSGMMVNRKLKFLLFAGEGIEQFFVRAEAKKGTPIEKMEELVKQIEKLIEALPEEELEDYRTSIGSIEEEQGFDPNAKRGAHLAQITVFLTPMQERHRRPQEIAADLRDKFKTIEGFDKLSTFLPREGPPVGAAVEVAIKGAKFETMQEIADKFMAYLEKRKGVSDVNTSYDFGKKQMSVQVDEEKAKEYGLTIDRIAQTVRNVFRGGVATTIKPQKAEEEIDVLVRFPEEMRNNEEVFKSIRVPNDRGNLVKLSSVASIETKEGIYRIMHEEGKRVVYVTAQVDNTNVTSLEINHELQKEFKDVTKDYQGYSVKYSGEFEDQMKSSKNLMISYLFALFLIFILLVAMFKSLIQPFIVMIAIPFGIIGVILSFWLHDIILPAGRPLNFFAMMGLVGLTGIVVNDSVVLVDFINRLRKKGKARRDSLIEGGVTRLRPVIMTSVTTIGGLISVAYGIGGGDPFLKPMALAIVWGLTFSTLLTLIGIPCIYAIVDDISENVLHRNLVKAESHQDIENLP